MVLAEVIDNFVLLLVPRHGSLTQFYLFHILVIQLSLN